MEMGAPGRAVFWGEGNPLVQAGVAFGRWGPASELCQVLCQAPPSPSPATGQSWSCSPTRLPAPWRAPRNPHSWSHSRTNTPTPCHLCFEGSRSSARRVLHPTPTPGRGVTDQRGQEVTLAVRSSHQRALPAAPASHDKLGPQPLLVQLGGLRDLGDSGSALSLSGHVTVPQWT